MRFDLAATDLDQQTAGFITGKDAYQNEQLARSNPNPDAYRNAHAVRLTGLIEPQVPFDARLELRPYLRTSRMDFLQHFLLGQPVERNGQESVGLMSTLTWDTQEAWSATAGIDLERAQSFLQEYQDQPTTGGSPAANAIRPQGWHYDYEVRSSVAALYGQVDYRFAERWHLGAGARAEYVGYVYDNRMIDGNTDDHGVPCGFGGCLYSRPADRNDSFRNVAPKITLAVDILDGLSAYANVSRGFRPPEMTELYRLQRRQAVAGLDSEQLDSVELGLKGSFASWRFALAAYDMHKRNVILRESNGFNVSNGRTSHRGVEYDVQWNALDSVSLVLGGTYALHRYEFSRAVDGGETITSGNDIDTAPRELQRVAVQWHPVAAVATEAEWLHVGAYWLDAANAHRYPGHELLNLRASWTIATRWTAALRLNNALDRAYADRADYAFGTYRYFPGRGRTLFAEFSWTMR
jgi:iron complex outermembrane receptor protein